MIDKLENATKKVLTRIGVYPTAKKVLTAMGLYENANERYKLLLMSIQNKNLAVPYAKWASSGRQLHDKY